MRIVLCLDYSSFTEKLLSSVRAFADELKNCEISVIHVIDETLFVAGTGFETQYYQDVKEDSAKLKELAEQYLGHIQYIEEFGMPRQKIDEILTAAEYDLIIVGDHSKSVLGARLLGSVAEHLLRNKTKPVLVIP